MHIAFIDTSMFSYIHFKISPSDICCRYNNLMFIPLFPHIHFSGFLCAIQTIRPRLGLANTAHRKRITNTFGSGVAAADARG